MWMDARAVVTFERGKPKGKAEGIVEGKVAGKAEGIVEGQATADEGMKGCESLIPASKSRDGIRAQLFERP